MNTNNSLSGASDVRPKLSALIQDMCPNGVEFKTLGEVLDYEQPTPYIVKNTDYDESYSTPVLTAGQSFILGYTNEKEGIYKASKEQPTIIFDDFTTSFHWVDFDFKVKSSAMKMLRPKNDANINFRFVFYAMQCIKFQATEHTRYWISKYSQFEIPLPPLEIQKKIVECLDKFSALAAELQAELQKRRTQYEYYRTRLLTPPQTISPEGSTDDRNWTWKTLGEIGEMIKGSGIQKSDFVEEGRPCIHYGQVHTYYGTFAYKNKSYISEELYAKCKKAHTGDLVIATTSEDVEACCKATAWLGKEDVAVSGDAHIYRHSQNPKYMAYLFQTEMFAQQKRKVATGAKVTRVHGNDILKFRFPFPSLEEQARIVAILDKFEALTTSLSDGIPAEQAAQQKRYEYYRDLLLTFPKAEK